MPNAKKVTLATSANTVRLRTHRCENDSRFAPKPAVPKLAARKPTAAQQLTQVFSKLRNLLLTEWPSIRSMNLGVKSGTGVIDQVLSVQLSQLCVQLHMLVVSDAEAAEALVLLVNKLDEQHFQQLQVLLDACGHDELSDYLRLLVGQPGPHNSKCHQAGKAGASSRSCMAASTGKPAKDGEELHTEQAAETSWQGRNRSTAGLFDWEGIGLPVGSRRSTNMGFNTTQETGSLRFASVLPPGHILAKTAEDLHRQHEFQEVLKSSSAAKTASTPAKKVQHQRQQAVPLLQLMPQKMSLAKQEDTVEQMRLAAYRDVLQYSSTTGSGMLLTTTHRRCSSSSSSSDNLYQPRGSPTAPWFPDTLHQDGLTGVEDWADARLAGLGCCEGSLDPGALWLPMFSAPVKSLEQIWKEGRKANTDAIFDHARLQVHLSPLDTLLLEPPVLLQPRLQPSAVLGSTSGKASSRRLSTSSRPTSAASGSRRATRLSSCGAGILSFAGASTVGPGPGAAANAASGSPGSVAGAGTNTHGLQLLHAVGSKNGSAGAWRLAGIAGVDTPLTSLPSGSGSVHAAHSSSKGVGWAGLEGKIIQGAPQVAAAGSDNIVYGGLQLDHVGTDNNSDSSLSHGITELLTSPSSIQPAASATSATSGVGLNSRVRAGAISAGAALAAHAPLLSPSQAVGPSNALGMQKRPISAESERSRPASAASTSRLRASTRGDLL